MKFSTFCLGLIVILFLAFIVSTKRKRIKFKPIILMLIVQLISPFLLLNTQFGLILITAVSKLFNELLKFYHSSFAGLGFLLVK